MPGSFDGKRDEKKRVTDTKANIFTILFQQCLKFFHQRFHFSRLGLFISLPAVTISNLEKKEKNHWKQQVHSFYVFNLFTHVRYFIHVSELLPCVYQKTSEMRHCHQSFPFSLLLLSKRKTTLLLTLHKIFWEHLRQRQWVMRRYTSISSVRSILSLSYHWYLEGVFFFFFFKSLSLYLYESSTGAAGRDAESEWQDEVSEMLRHESFQDSVCLGSFLDRSVYTSDHKKPQTLQTCRHVDLKEEHGFMLRIHRKQTCP